MNMEATGRLPLEGIVVVDESEGPMAGLATMVLADFGAHVIKLEAPGGDPWRATPGARLWLRGKRSVVLAKDDAAGRDALATHADVWVRGPAQPQDFAGDAALVAINPRLIIGWVSAFGRTGPYAGYPASEALVAARVGRMLQFRGAASRDGPVYAALQVATHAASQSLLAGVLAALHARERDGVGQVLETSLARGLLAYEMNNVLFGQANAWLLARGEAALPAPPDPLTAMPTLNYHPLRAADGQWLQMGNLLPHLFRHFVDAVGLTEAFEALGETGPTESWPEGKREAFRSLMLARLQQKTADEWQRIFVADGSVASHPYQTTQQALSDPDVTANGHAVPLAGGGSQLGLLANLTGSPGRVGERAPQVGEHTVEVMARCAGAGMSPAAVPTTPPPGASVSAAAAPALRRPPPLAGVTVVEAATIIAAPFGTSLLADMGARVIKFEPIEGDPFRGMAPGLGAARVNTGKESIALDLKQSRARELAQRIVAGADVFIHNYRPGVPERLGLAWAQLSAINPRLVYLSANGYGPAGPGALRPSTHPIPGAAMGGVLWQIGGPPEPGAMDEPQLRETARQLMRANEVNPDPNTSLVVCSAALLGLTARQRLGIGQAMFVDMFGTNAWANFDDAITWPGKPARPMPDRAGFGLHPLWRLYRAQIGWVFLGIDSPAAWDGLRAHLAIEVAGEPALALDYAAAREGGAAVTEALTRLFARAPAAQWEARLASRGLGCVQADAATPDAFFLRDPQAVDQGLTLPAVHPQWGAYRRHGALTLFAGTPGVYRGTTALGGSTEALLAELGVPADERAALRATGVVA
jgi:crotonobetainyl-CoA:carnitine CoA-transferase CaiB-like acyl-CoA transferase